jgi:hypothetical protein
MFIFDVSYVYLVENLRTVIDFVRNGDFNVDVREYDGALKLVIHFASL